MSTRSLAADRWRAILQRQQSSGLSVAAFCRRTGVSPASFYARRQKLRGEVTFAEVKLPPAMTSKSGGVASTDTDGIELRLPGQRCVVVRPGFDRQTLLALLHTLEANSADMAAREVGA